MSQPKLSEDQLVTLENVANGMRGMCFDPSIHKEAKEALRNWVKDLDGITNYLLADR